MTGQSLRAVALSTREVSPRLMSRMGIGPLRQTRLKRHCPDEPHPPPRGSFGLLPSAAGRCGKSGQATIGWAAARIARTGRWRLRDPARPLLPGFPTACGPPNQKTNPSSGWSFFAYCRVLERVRAGSCGLRRFAGAPGLGRIHSLRAIFLSGLAARWRPKSTSTSNGRITNQHLMRGPFKRLIRGIGRRRGQRRRSDEREMPSGC